MWKWETKIGSPHSRLPVLGLRCKKCTRRLTNTCNYLLPHTLISHIRGLEKSIFISFLVSNLIGWRKATQMHTINRSTGIAFEARNQIKNRNETQKSLLVDIFAPDKLANGSAAFRIANRNLGTDKNGTQRRRWLDACWPCTVHSTTHRHIRVSAFYFQMFFSSRNYFHSRMAYSTYNILMAVHVI